MPATLYDVLMVFGPQPSAAVKARFRQNTSYQPPVCPSVAEHKHYKSKPIWGITFLVLQS